MVFGEGKIEILGQPVVLNALLTELGILKNLETKNLEHIIYHSAKDAGRQWFQGMGLKYGLRPQDIMQWGPELINLAGWGIVKPINTNIVASELNFELLNSTMATYYGKSNYPVDHYFRGLVTGAWQNACTEQIEGIETECIAMGGKTCKFEIKPKNKLDLSSASVKKQLGL